jgi:DNA-binding transcriptional MocR family regulator
VQLPASLSDCTPAELNTLLNALQSEYQQHCDANLALDLTRGKPSAEQLDLSDALDGILAGNYSAADGTDCRNYGGLHGLPELRALGAQLLGTAPAQTIAGGSSSLTLMYFTLLFANLFGLAGAPAWNSRGGAKIICPVPGYDRHFAICERLGIEMITVAMNSDGPDMDAVEQLLASDSSIVGMWNVPKYSNPTGITYSSAVVTRIAKLGALAQPGFLVLWDNAYAVHDIAAATDPLTAIAPLADAAGTQVVQFASTSKVTHAGAGVSFMAGSKALIDSVVEQLGIAMIGPDKVNQLRHVALLKEGGLERIMAGHKALLAPRFAAVEEALAANFSDSALLSWTRPNGGYFVSVDTLPGIASRVVALAAAAGVKLTPAGATFPYNRDPQDSNIRLAPSFPSLADVVKTMQVFCCCVQLASVEQQLATG